MCCTRVAGNKGYAASEKISVSHGDDYLSLYDRIDFIRGLVYYI